MNEDPRKKLWLDRWRDDRIGFHQPEHNRHLIAHGTSVFGEPTRRVLVPLSGKSLDLLWLEEHGYEVFGVEYVERAVIDFLEENGRSYVRDRVGEATTYISDRISTAVGDFFTIEPEALGLFDAVYDRAAMIAIAPERREEYVARLTRLLSDDGTMLLVTIDYPPEEKEGPPHSLTESSVRELFGARYEIETLHAEDILERQEKWKDDGVTRLWEYAFAMRKR